MQITPEELKRAYREMGDEELLAIETDELTEVARKCHADELDRRGLHAGAVEEAGDAFDVDGKRWASAGTFRSVDEAHLAHGLLQSADIPAEIETDSGDVLWMGSTAHRISRVLVPADLLGDAHSVIESHAMREELAAREGAEPLPDVIGARYEDGVFKPLDPVDWQEGTEVEVRLAGR